MIKTLKLPAIVLTVLLLATACSSDTQDPAASESTGAETSEPTTAPAEAVETADEDPLAGEKIELSECVDSSLECGTVTVPVDYNDESLGTLDIAIAIHRAMSPDSRIGYLFVNPGGPGASGVEFAAAAEYGPGVGFSDAVLERFDVVGFDPRGVAASEPLFECGAVGEQQGILNQIDEMVDTDEEIALGEQAVELCETSMGPVAGLLGSESVARDMDEIRKALGADQINYFGASYGSTLGVWYATLFPDHVRAMVVDGADNPVDDLSTQATRTENALAEIRQFEVLLNEALLACDSAECPIFNGGDPIGFYLDVVDELDLVEEAFNGDKTAAPLAIITPLYSEATWPALWDGLAALEQGDAQPLIDQALLQLDEIGVVSFTGHVNCLDVWSLQPSFDRSTRLADAAASQAAMNEELPLLAVLFDESMVETCPFYDTIVGAPLGQPLDGSDVPILVIGNPSDPATPFTESVELVESTLNNGYLLEVDHASHVVYPANSCANELIHSVLVDRSFPSERRTVCEREEPEEVQLSEQDMNDFLFEMCESSAAPGAASEDLEAACTEAIEQLSADYDSEAVLEAFLGGDVSALEAFIENIEESFTKFNITVDPTAFTE